MNFSNIISDFTWSYSRIGQFEMCPYGFLLKYIKKTKSKRHQFFSGVGSLVHEMIEMYLKGELTKDELPIHYLLNFSKAVKGKAPSELVFSNFFTQCLDYFKTIDFPYMKPLGIELSTEFDVGGSKFTGIIDCVAEDDGKLVILDNKSRKLRPRSWRRTPTESDRELDKYLRQLYLYSIPIKQQFGRYPDRLEFNCYRTQRLISEPFKESELERTKVWAIGAIENITNNEEWKPDVEFFKCNYLCDVCDSCEYYQMNFGREKA